MDKLNTEKNTKKTIKSTKSTKNNKISIEDDIDDLGDKYDNMKITEKNPSKSINELTKNDIIIINNTKTDIKKYEKLMNFLKIHISREYENIELEKNDTQ